MSDGSERCGEVGGLVAAPLALSLETLRAMPARTQITRHDCVEGRSAIERQLGYKQAKYLMAANAVASLDGIGSDKEGYWEDRAGYKWFGGI